ncbi:MAG: NAD(P)-dependent oxidoreductase [Oscillospiraceae bacterium]|nr:NAD(P)-dependent oxidoreductase [Oscillospiraceae bacterium]MBR5364013.1 NAD(P)-dependent oxidoreductase [Oscillospiraceae bacterium]
MKKVIIFGATGNVGSYVTKYASEFFKDSEYQVIASGRRNTDVFNQFGVEFVQVDMMNKEDFDRLPQEDVYAVILLAATIPSYMSDYSGEAYLRTNIMGTYNVLEYCRKVKADRIMFSQTVFDVSLYSQADPNYVIKPYDAPNFSYTGDHAMYVISKNTAIEMLKHYFEEYGLKYFVFRFPTIYEYSTFKYYYPNGVKTMRPLYRQIERAKNSEPLELWGDPNYAKDMVHVYDCAQMICKAVIANRDHGIYNVGTGIPVTLEEQCQAIIDVFSPKDKPSTIEYHPGKSGGGFLMDITNAKEELGYEPVYDVHKLFEDYKYEEQFDRFKSLRGE